MSSSNAPIAPAAEPVSDAANPEKTSWLSRKWNDATFRTGFWFAMGDLLVTASGRFMPTGSGDKNWNPYKVTTGVLGVLNSLTYMFKDELDYVHNPDQVITELDDALTQVIAGEQEIASINAIPNPVKDPQAAMQAYQRNAGQIGSAWLTAAMALNVVNGASRGNVPEMVNGLMNVPAYGLTSVYRAKDTAPDPRPLHERLGETAVNSPSEIGAPLAVTATGMGFLAGIRDIFSNKVPFMAGALQVAAYTAYTIGDFVYHGMSKGEAGSGKGTGTEGEKGDASEFKRAPMLLHNLKIARDPQYREQVQQLQQAEFDASVAEFEQRETVRAQIYDKAAELLAQKDALNSGVDHQELLDSVGRFIAYRVKQPFDVTIAELQSRMESEISL